ncbi:MAG: radical SAM protein [Ignavibacteriae bacterium HGW-Ignavibacteriae-3]|nr:MAG: radical SAM protein [Ignavibacteriae bacterium HGW-Ignavibacteriae-3]
MAFIPSYIKLLETGELKKRAESALKILQHCLSCPQECGIDRTSRENGLCHSGYFPILSSFTPHHGEEPVLSGSRGAGNIFFGNCNLKCLFCQNYEISQNWNAERKNEVSFEELADIMLLLQSRGCHNVGFVSPTHFSAQILKSVLIAAENGLHLPLIYNSNGYDSVEMLKLYDGVVDIYLPDFKYGDNETAKKYSNARDYFDHACRAIKEMFRQVGDELIYEDGVVVRGLIIRHLVLPNGLADSEKVFKFISEELSPNVHISLMSQYYPTNKSHLDILIDRPIRQSEYEKSLVLMELYGLHNGWAQEMGSQEFYRPDFNSGRDNPFRNK